jgi:hypothetical protein
VPSQPAAGTAFTCAPPPSGQPTPFWGYPTYQCPVSAIDAGDVADVTGHSAPFDRQGTTVCYTLTVIGNIEDFTCDWQQVGAGQ